MEVSAAQFYPWPKKSLAVPTNAGGVFNVSIDLEAKALIKYLMFYIAEEILIGRHL